MKDNESNFIYLKKTSMEQYYDELVKAEYVCEYFPIMTKIIARKIIEAFLKNIATKNGIESNVGVWNLLDNIKLSSSFSLPTEMYESIEIILVNGYDNASLFNRNKTRSKNPIEVLEIVHNILCWYIRIAEPQAMELAKDLIFKAPCTIEYQQKQVHKIKDDILLKDNQINNLRQKIIELGSQSKSIIEMNRIIIAIKEEKSHLEDVKILLTKKIKEQEIQVADVEKNYKVYIKKIELLEEECKESQELIFNKESQLVKTEIQMQGLKALIKEQDEQDESITRMEHTLEEELKTVRKVYENLVNLSVQYQDILETIEFSHDKELQKILENKIHSVTMQISFEDRIFNENITVYTKNIIEAKRKAAIFKEILNENLKREIRYQPFYRGFLELESKELRIIYTIITNISTSTNLLSKTKELFTKSSEDKFLDTINKNLKELKNISDDEIKLIVYYKLIKLSQVNLGKIYNRKKFIQALDNAVDRAYEILMIRKDFKGRVRKLDAIGAYYLEKVVADIKSKNSSLQISDELVDKIYKEILILKQDSESMGKENIYYDKTKLEGMLETINKTSIKSHVYTYLSAMIELGGVSSYKDVATIILEVEEAMVQRPVFKIFEEENLTGAFSNEYFIIHLFLSSGSTLLNPKQQEDLLPLLVIAIISVSLISKSDEHEVDMKSYNSLIELWKHKQQKYNDIFIEKEDKENELKVLIKEKNEIENNFEKLSKYYDILSKDYTNYEEEFKDIVMKSEKVILLPSYTEYDKLRNKKEEAENNIDETRNKLGTLKSILSPEMWRDQASKLINESSMMDLEKLLIEEAKQKSYFKKEYKIFEDLKTKIQETNNLIDKEKEKLKNINLLIYNNRNKINELQIKLNNIKDVYIDMEEGY
jgi:hypothetical protein